MTLGRFINKSIYFYVCIKIHHQNDSLCFWLAFNKIIYHNINIRIYFEKNMIKLLVSLIYYTYICIVSAGVLNGKGNIFTILQNLFKIKSYAKQ